MKTLDLNTYGVQEMNAVEMRETDGGFFAELIAVAIAVAVVTELILAVKEALSK